MLKCFLLLSQIDLALMSSYTNRLMVHFMSASNRRLEEEESSGIPWWVDFLVVSLLIFFFYRLLKALMALSQKWTE